MIAGRYEPLEGGLARDVELDRVVRLRWIGSVDEVDDPRLSHPNVLRVFDVGEHEGRRFAAVEHVDGVPLAAAAPLPLGETIALGVRASRALNEASPELPPLDADTPRKLERALNRARPQATIPLPTLVLPQLPKQRRRAVVGLVAAALLALAIGLVAAFAGGGGSGPRAQPTTRTVQVTPVPPQPDAEAQARALAAWLSRWSP